MQSLRFVILGLLSSAAVAAPPVETKLPSPPKLAAQPVTETYFGTPVTDRFRFVEQLSPDTLTWMRAQAAHTRAVLDSIAPRQALLEKISTLGGQFGVVRDVQYAGNKLFYQRRAPGSDVYDLVVRDGGTERVLVDITQRIKDKGGVPQAIDGFEPSRDGTRIAVRVSEKGSEDSVLTILDTATGNAVAGPQYMGPFTDTAWTDDGTGLFFGREPILPADAPRELKYQNAELLWWNLKDEPRIVVGAKQKLGPNTDPVRFPVMALPEGSNMAVLLIINGVENEVEAWVAPLADAKAGTASWRKIISKDDAVTNMSGDAQHLYLLTHKNAPGFKVTVMPYSGTAATATTLVDEAPEQFLESIAVAKDAVYVGGRKRLQGQLLRVGADGKAAAIALPTATTIFQIHADPSRPGVVVAIDGPTVPVKTLAYDPGTGTLGDLKLEQRPAIDFARYRSIEMDAVAKDGTRVPMTILTAAGPTVPRPTLLDAYGAYGISALPYFDPRNLAFVDAGGSFVECNVRGGGELGESWRLGGKDANKPNTWRDAIACGEALVKGGFTTPSMLAITGTSAGGIMVGRAATERPDLFAAAISRVGDSNATRSETMPGGPANVPEFGTVKDPQGFKNLLAMDAYLSVRDGTRYPAWMLTTGLSDPRVAPWQAGKMAARLSEASSSPVFLRVEEAAGHGMGSTRSNRDAEAADIFGFVLWRAGVPEWQPTK